MQHGNTYQYASDNRYAPETDTENLIVHSATEFALRLRAATDEYARKYGTSEPESPEKIKKRMKLFGGIKKGLGMAHERQKQALTLKELAEAYLFHQSPFEDSHYGPLTGPLLVSNVLNLLDQAYNHKKNLDLSHLPKHGSKLKKFINDHEVEKHAITIIAAITGENEEVIRKNMDLYVDSKGEKGQSMSQYIADITGISPYPGQQHK